MCHYQLSASWVNSITGEGYLPNQGMPSMELAGEVKKKLLPQGLVESLKSTLSMKNLIITAELARLFLTPNLQKKIDHLDLIDIAKKTNYTCNLSFT